jgi:hypothetical protein
MSTALDTAIDVEDNTALTQYLASCVIMEPRSDGKVCVYFRTKSGRKISTWTHNAGYESWIFAQMIARIDTDEPVPAPAQRNSVAEVNKAWHKRNANPEACGGEAARIRQRPGKVTVMDVVDIVHDRLEAVESLVGKINERMDTQDAALVALASSMTDMHAALQAVVKARK